MTAKNQRTDEPRLWWSATTDEEATVRRGDGLRGVRLREVWASRVGFVVGLELRAWDGGARAAVATLLRLVGDAGAQVGRAAPVVGVFVRTGSDPILTATLARWAADQDWHRGDFLLWPQVVSADAHDEATVGPPTIGQLARELIGPLAHAGAAAPRLQGERSVRDVLASVLVGENLGPTRSLIESLSNVDGTNHRAVVEAWTDEVLAQARSAAESATAETTKAPEDGHETRGAK